LGLCRRQKHEGWTEICALVGPATPRFLLRRYRVRYFYGPALGGSCSSFLRRRQGASGSRIQRGDLEFESSRSKGVARQRSSSQWPSACVLSLLWFRQRSDGNDAGSIRKKISRSAS